MGSYCRNFRTVDLPYPRTGCGEAIARYIYLLAVFPDDPNHAAMPCHHKHFLLYVVSRPLLRVFLWLLSVNAPVSSSPFHLDGG